VAARSGSSIGSLYRFFSNKEQLVDAIADQIAQRYRALPTSVLNASASIACVRTGMRLIGRATRATRQSVIAEVKAVLTSYLRSRTEASCP